MRQFNQVRASLMTAAAIAVLVSSSCAPSIPAEQAESELAAFMLDRIAQQETGGPSAPVKGSPQPWAAAPADAAIIVWAPPVERIEPDSIKYLRTEQAVRVWWLAGDQLVEVTDRQEAIEAFRQAHMSDPSSRKWGYYEFGILSLTNGNRDAEIYLGVSCGPLCGEGIIYVLHRNDSGQWEIKDTRNIWIT